jgi:hypothetical protein
LVQSAHVKVEVCTLDADSCCSIDPDNCGGLQWIVIPTETGWGETGPATNHLETVTPTATTVTTTRPTILNLETNIATWAAQTSEGNNEEPIIITGPNNVRSSTMPGQTADNNAGGEDSSATGSANGLLLDIVSHIGGALSNVQPTQPASPATNGLGQPVAPTNTDNRESGASALPATTPGSGMPSNTNMVSSGQTTAAGGVGEFVYRTQTLTLTPGLSTNIGSNWFPTYVELTTDAKGNNLVTVFADGTAVTATVRVAPTTMVIPKSGFEASTTDSANPSEQTGKLAITSSKGAGPDRRSELELWMGAVLGVLGIGTILYNA